MLVCNCTTAAQYFHVLRRQMRGGKDGRGIRKPLILFTPKSLLRHPRVSSSLDELGSGHFQELVNATESLNKEKVTRILIASGKICYDLLGACEEKRLDDVVILKLEQLYPFPKNLLRKELRKYPNANDVVWVQEEPQNMGGWSFLRDRIASELKGNQALRYVGRPESASTASGALKVHSKEQAGLVKSAISPVGAKKG
jgi:2-oxoglutarate dehydrogenase E1 component